MYAGSFWLCLLPRIILQFTLSAFSCVLNSHCVSHLGNSRLRFGSLCQCVGVNSVDAAHQAQAVSSDVNIKGHWSGLLGTGIFRLHVLILYWG